VTGPIVTVDRGRCIGSGMCVFSAPATFSQDSDAKAVALNPVEDDVETIRAAVDSCPTHALTMTSDQGAH
jgi:ferredoxin